MKRHSSTLPEILDNSTQDQDPEEIIAKRSKISTSEPNESTENNVNGNASGFLVVRTVSQINSNPEALRSEPQTGIAIPQCQEVLNDDIIPSMDISTNNDQELDPVDPVASSSSTSEFKEIPTVNDQGHHTVDPVDPTSELREITAVNDRGLDPVEPVAGSSSVDNEAATDNPNKVKQETDDVDSKTGIKSEVKTEIKDEATPSSANSSSTAVPCPAPIRPTCNFGIKCYMRNPLHRNVMAHPGDSDYRRPAYPPAPPGTLNCPFGASCYRRNPQHFVQLQHPPSDTYNTVGATATIPVVAPPQRQPHIVTNSPQPQPNRRPRPVYVAITSNDTDDDDDDEEDGDLDGLVFNLSPGNTSDEYNPTESEEEDD